ncbi:MAG: TrwC relaxase [Thermoleophilia bacterium]|nr:TrwC relaxase [Thermoleophilia bacterium]
MLTIKKISSLDAVEYGRYLAGAELKPGQDHSRTSPDHGDYYLADVDGSLQGGGAMWIGLEGDRAQWGMSGEIDADKLARLMRGEHATASALHVLDERGGKWREMSPGDHVDPRSARYRSVVVRVPGYALDPDSLRVAIATRVQELGGWDRLDPQQRAVAEKAVFGRLEDGVRQTHPGARLDGSLRGKDRDIRALAEPCEQEGLVRISDHRRPVCNSHDFTFSAPKSVSLGWAAAGDADRAKIELAVMESSQAAMEYMARTMSCVKVKRQGRLEYEPARGVVGASFLHHSARGVDGARPDPQLHVHTLVVGVKRADGKLVTPDQAAWMRHGREGGAYFRCDLARRLRGLGLDIESQTGKQARYFELADISAEVIERYCSRSREVRDHESKWIREHGERPSAIQAAAFARQTRSSKGVEGELDLRRQWRRELAKDELDRVSVAYMMSARNIHRDETLQMRYADVTARILDAMEEAGSMVRDREVRSIALECSAGKLSPTEATLLVRSMQQQGLILSLENGMVTTSRLRAAEEQILASCDRQIATPAIASHVTNGAVDRVQQQEGIDFSGEQFRSIQLGASNVAVCAIKGYAGTGKGLSLAAISQAAREAGHGVIVVSTMGKRAQKAASEANASGASIDGLVNGAFVVTEGVGQDLRERRELRPGDVIIVDEAGMVDTPRYAKLSRTAEEAGARLVLVGDPAQLSPIGPGGMFEQLLDRVPTAELTEVRRTDVAWLLEMQAEVRQGNAARAIELLQQNDALHISDTTDEAVVRMVDDWDRERKGRPIKDSQMIIPTSNEDVDRANELAQHRRLKSGEIAGVGVQAPDRPYLLHPGEPVAFRGSSYRPDGDRVVLNGTPGMVVGVDAAHRRVRVRVHEPNRAARIVDVHLDRMGESALRLEYASHVMPAQGESITRTYELSGSWATSREAAYVGASRHRESHKMYVSREALGVDGDDVQRLERLADRMNRSAAPSATLTFAVEAREIAAPIVADPFERAVRQYQLKVSRQPSGDHSRSITRIERAAVEHPPAFVVHAIGRRPEDRASREVWDEGAKAMAHFHAAIAPLSARSMDMTEDQPFHVNGKFRDLKRTCAEVQRALRTNDEALRFTHDLAKYARGREARRVDRSRDLGR